MDTSTTTDTDFEQDVREGLTAFPKFLYSKYIYDAKGDALFQQIMDLPEYYLTNCELEIFQTQTAEITAHFKGNGQGFDLIELGAGDGKKTKILLKHMQEMGYDFVYKPVDISSNAIADLSASLQGELPLVETDPEVGEYFEVLDRLKAFDKRKKVIMMLGSNIGNLLHKRAIAFLSRMQESMNPEDQLFMGFDQTKDPQVVLDAYNDPTGVTAAFNLNLLHRINRELGGNFAVDKFKHWEVYDPETGTAKSYLLATEAMEVHIGALDLKIRFDQWETIHTEISQKYTDTVVDWIAGEAGLERIATFKDSRNYYKNYLFKKRH
ncbi:L-histidine N(alpha)-methyltransferase [Aureitalea marina]|uniref:Dimethylhistidine N-methyltransferase n=1 Tax=Aureitalea marina TaxID=930804 RepID=A0A2S7KR37_9FLAO|nr:L-histidine N(alpha)-methyltransferase [Aureitalea marina]PQB05067.1 dimethylhistidine N-methyltransferase [Aureitalea marina]